ncbi:hypothetical protein VSH64_08165 [Amycolatopsis rhabdoformis]|uniref:Uncharacterized protein n=1 Tax=Amycolatopsis rhabdoformis TaxID=1448059 RepID=A0ABZ1IF46_9PSEU|nr:hypothetical protein [Amycolatopsis rhabdoformis]WSE32080.1 hypothetical protein VSH64_08165 [Amycolatopsis rhabdoformis]
MVHEPTPDEAVAALRTVRESREQVIESATGSRWLSVVLGLGVFLGCAANDLLPASLRWVSWVLLGLLVVLALGMLTPTGGALVGRPLLVSDRNQSVGVRLLRVAPIVGIGIVVAVGVEVFGLAHGKIYYGALIGLYIVFADPPFQRWLLRRPGRGSQR